MNLEKGTISNPRMCEIMNIMNIPWSGGYSSNLWENPLPGNLHHNISAATPHQPSGQCSFLRKDFFHCKLSRRINTASTIMSLVVNKERIGVEWLDTFLWGACLCNARKKVICLGFYIFRFLVFSWYLLGLESRAQMLNYGKPVMGLPLCQTELDEGLGHLDILDHLQKMQDFHWLASHWWEWLSDDK